MAIVSAVPGLRVAIVVDGKALEEYTDHDDGANLDKSPHISTSYIESKLGHSFAIEGEFQNCFQCQEDDLAIVILIDGVRVPSLKFPKQTRGKNFRWCCNRVLSFEEGVWNDKELIFGELTLTEDEIEQDAFVQSRKLGTISLFFVRCRIRDSPQNAQARGRRLTSGTYSEKSLKGSTVSNQTTYKTMERGITPKFCNITYLGPIATFHFRYRDKATLQALGVMARSSSSSTSPDHSTDEHSNNEIRADHIPIKTGTVQQQEPPQDDLPIEQLSREDLEEIARRYRANITTLGRGVKREHSPTEDDALMASTLRASKYKSTFDTTLGREVVNLDS